jgi:hypothetical protein
LNRYGFFLKLGDDSRPYLGWTLYGFNGMGNFNPPITPTIKPPGGSFTVNLLFYPETPKSNSSRISKRPFIKLSELPVIPTGAEVGVFTDKPPSGGLTDYPLVNLDSESGYVTTSLTRNTPENYSGTVDLRNSSTRRYDFFHMQSFHDNEFFHTLSWAVPFRHR